jgi:hypothetical protein
VILATTVSSRATERQRKHKYMADVDFDVEAEGEFRWEIANFSELVRRAHEQPEEYARVYSPTHTIGGIDWCVASRPGGLFTPGVS